MTINEKISFIHGYVYARAEMMLKEDPKIWEGYTVQMLVERILGGLVNNEQKKEN
ncbi:hypothetical protein II5_03068 [Bacillus cereus MSX-A1]|uniref:hypothetical protein n=1 Tax=Bacillus cereus TaxID=1396 RepID=UPI0002795338|nr:hypothetical protein [Bacillus cereus]EJR05078.1 hypothetical protein II5_03068 [Bacillus cereus MSX-A1]